MTALPAKGAVFIEGASLAGHPHFFAAGRTNKANSGSLGQPKPKINCFLCTPIH